MKSSFTAPCVVSAGRSNRAGCFLMTALTVLLCAVLLPTVGTAATYYYESGNPSLPGSWGTTSGAGLGTAATNFTTASDVFIIENGYTATLLSNLVIGSGTNAVTLTVQSGGTLNTSTFAVQFAGNGSAFDLQSDATLQTSNVDGIQGNANNLGAVQITAGTPASVTLTYSPTANYIFSTSAASTNARIAATGNKPAITQAANITINGGGTNQWQFSSNMNMSGILTVQNGWLTLTGGVFTLNAAGSTVQNGAQLMIANGQLNIANPGILTMQNGSIFRLFASATIPAVSSNYVS